MQKSQFWTAIVRLPMTFAPVSDGIRLDLVGWTTM